ncbi:MAG: hypothetical protein D6730_21965 [Bacteroidetes bacterium]|nr:MAG: hypothetical protein D6730_21965 [Bacteroidota bacterium]
MLYLHHSSCISPQPTFGKTAIESLRVVQGNQLQALEPAYAQIPRGLLRRMGKAVRMGTGAAMPLLQQQPKPDGIIIGTGNGGLEDCIRFLNQIMEYEEGRLTPTNFVQSTANAIAAQIGLLSQNTGYNITHVHRGLAFENALLDAHLRLVEFPHHHYLLVGVDEISAYNFNIDLLDGWYKREAIANNELYDHPTDGSIAGESAAAFVVSGEAAGAAARLVDLKFIHGTNAGQVSATFQALLQRQAGRFSPEEMWYISGENGDRRMQPFYQACEALLPASCGILRFKHLCGEHPTASAFGLWLAGELLKGGQLAGHLVKRQPKAKAVRHIVMYNTFKGSQHSWMVLSRD